MLCGMNTLPHSIQALHGVGPTGWSAASAAPADTGGGRQAAAWFNEPLLEGSQVLRAPVQPAGGDGQALCERFLACLAAETT